MRVLTYVPDFQVLVSRRCAYACGYCNFPNTPALVPPSKKQVRRMLNTAARLGAIQLTLTAGEGIESSEEILSVCRYYGFHDYYDYLKSLCQYILERKGNRLFFPVLDVGAVPFTELRKLRPVLPIARLMLESADDSLLSKVAHRNAPHKAVRARMAALEDFCRADIPLITGIRVGIGEAPASWQRAAELVSQLNAKYGNIQSFVIRPFYPVPYSEMANLPPATDEMVIDAIKAVRGSLDRRILVSTQLAPGRLHLACRVASAGADDLGAICLGSSERIDFGVAGELQQAQDEAALKGVKVCERMPFIESFLKRYRLPDNISETVARYRRLSEKVLLSDRGAAACI